MLPGNSDLCAVTTQNCCKNAETFCDDRAIIHCGQGCSLGLDVLVSRWSQDVVSKRLGLVETWEGLGLDLVLDRNSNVSVSSLSHRVSFTSQYTQLFASLQWNCFVHPAARPLAGVFSQSGLIMRPTRSHLTPITLAKLVFVKCNKNLS